jgi:hypothetical protein
MEYQSTAPLYAHLYRLHAKEFCDSFFKRVDRWIIAIDIIANES